MIELTDSDVAIKYINGFYDGPISGVCEWNGSRYYFDMIEESEWINDDFDPGWYRKYGLYELSDEEWQYEDYKHSEFVKYVGNHFDCVDNKRDYEGIKPLSEWHKFYDQKFKPTVPLGDPIAIWIR